MKITVILRKIDANRNIVDYIERRCSFAFGHLSTAIRKASITLSDVNGPKGGVDKLCRIVIQPEGLPKIVITEEQQSLRSAIDRCISRASQNLSRRIKRRRLSFRDKTLRQKLSLSTLENRLSASTR